jgi:hypothetical integral membrane protein (TIGR02206 family)
MTPAIRAQIGHSTEVQGTRQFSPSHLAALGMLALLAAPAVWAPRRHGGPWVRAAARGLALVIAGAYLVEYAANAAEGALSWGFSLPLQLTDAVTFVAVAALWAPRPLLVELLYFWAFTASLQAVVTPDLGQAFPSVFYFTYFTTHIGVVVAACLLVFGCDLRPRPDAPWRALAATAAWAVLAGAGDLLTGGNYMFLRAKPDHPSLLDVMGPWPWYIGSAALLALAMFWALYALAQAAPRC